MAKFRTIVLILNLHRSQISEENMLVHLNFCNQELADLVEIPFHVVYSPSTSIQGSDKQN